MNEDLFPPNITIDPQAVEEAHYEDDEEYASSDEESDAEDGQGGFAIDEEDLDTYVVDDEWGSLVTDESKGIYKQMMDAVSKRTPKILHDFAYTAWVCSVRPVVVEDAKKRLVGNAAARTAIERCVRKLLSNDVDGQIDGGIDRKVDVFWDELKAFQTR